MLYHAAAQAARVGPSPPGWLLALTVLTGIFVEVSNLLGGLRRKPPSWASWLRIAVGVALIVFGASIGG